MRRTRVLSVVAISMCSCLFTAAVLGTESVPVAEAKTVTSAPLHSPSVKLSHLSATSATLSWGWISGARKYQIYRNGRLLDTTTRRSFVDKSLHQDARYAYTVYAIGAHGKSKGRSVVVTTPFSAPPSRPGNLKVYSVTQTSVTLTWSGASRATQYSVLVNGKTVGSTRRTAFTVTGLSSGQTYTVAVYASNSRGHSPEATARVTTKAISSPIPAITLSSGTPSSSGVTPGILVSGESTEDWSSSGGGIQVDDLPFSASSNLIPIYGKITSSYRQDLMVDVASSSVEGEVWTYSIPVQSDGSFSATITLPFTGDDYVAIGEGNPGLQTFTNLLEVNNPQPNLSANQMALLESWLVNYTESTSILSTATQITQAATSTDGKIKAVSDWVSQNIWYNFPALNANAIPWQQATQTLQLGHGVCQDEAAVAASYLRSLGIPTRWVGGEAYDATTKQDLGGHAWDEAWDGTRWVIFDATWNQVYYQSTAIAAPAGITSQWFDANSSTFAQTHVPDLYPYEW